MQPPSNTTAAPSKSSVPPQRTVDASADESYESYQKWLQEKKEQRKGILKVRANYNSAEMYFIVKVNLQQCCIIHSDYPFLTLLDK